MGHQKRNEKSIELILLNKRKVELEYFIVEKINSFLLLCPHVKMNNYLIIYLIKLIPSF